jgi:hypothetical protein
VGALAQSASKSSLVGKLEGPEVVTDAGMALKAFKEAPQLHSWTLTTMSAVRYKERGVRN